LTIVAVCYCDSLKCLILYTAARPESTATAGFTATSGILAATGMLVTAGTPTIEGMPATERTQEILETPLAEKEVNSRRDGKAETLPAGA
jgi:hypothetical protein